MTPPRRYCLARRRDNRGPCHARPIKGKRRCRNHGGQSTGARTVRGFQKEARAGAAKMVALLHAMGLRHPGGKPRTLKRTKTMAEEAKEHLTELRTELVVLAPASRDLATMTSAEKWATAAVRGIDQLYAIIDQPIDFDNLKQQRLIGDMSLGVNKLFQRAASSERNDKIADKLLAEIRAERIVSEIMEK